jgi:hypothetical protein
MKKRRRITKLVGSSKYIPSFSSLGITKNVERRMISSIGKSVRRDIDKRVKESNFRIVGFARKGCQPAVKMTLKEFQKLCVSQ